MHGWNKNHYFHEQLQAQVKWIFSITLMHTTGNITYLRTTSIAAFPHEIDFCDIEIYFFYRNWLLLYKHKKYHTSLLINNPVEEKPTDTIYWSFVTFGWWKWQEIKKTL